MARCTPEFVCHAIVLIPIVSLMVLPVLFITILFADLGNWNTVTWIVMFLCILPI